MTLSELKTALLAKLDALGETMAPEARAAFTKAAQWAVEEEAAVARAIGRLTAHGYTVLPPDWNAIQPVAVPSKATQAAAPNPTPSAEPEAASATGILIPQLQAQPAAATTEAVPQPLDVPQGSPAWTAAHV